jgi:flagellin
MSSILTNNSALTALQSLQQTQQALSTTQNQVSTGLKVSNAKDNASYWAIAQQLNSASGVTSAANDAMAESQAILDTANSAIKSVIGTINSIQTTLTQASNSGADYGSIQTTLTSLGNALKDAVNGASFNGVNLLDGSQTSMSFVSGFTASAGGGSLNTIGFSAQAMTGSGSNTTTVYAPNVTDSATIGYLQGLTDNTGSVSSASYGQDIIDNTTNPNAISITHVALDGTQTVTNYSALDANGNSTTVGAAASFGVSIQTTTSNGMLTQNGLDITALNISNSANAKTALTAVNAALKAVSDYAAQIGATQSRMTAASSLNSALVNNYTTGSGALVDADMNQASARLQALQTQQQLGIQSLSIANQNSQLILKLFQ